MSLGKAMYAGFTLGGLATSVDGQVLRDDGAVVAGLYAVGACASNIAQDGKGYASGTQLGEGRFSGVAPERMRQPERRACKPPRAATGNPATRHADKAS